MSSMFIYPYKVGSRSVAVLKELLDAKIIKLEGSRYQHRAGHTVINYGNSRRPDWWTEEVNVLNHPDNVAIAKDKLETFRRLEEAGVSTVPYTTDAPVAQDWLRLGHKVFVRNSLNGHSGEGIEVVTPRTTAEYTPEQRSVMASLSSIADSISGGLRDGILQFIDEIDPEGMTTETTVPAAPLYTRAVANAGEYRVHVYHDDVILYQKKSRRLDENNNVVTAEGEQADIRNLASNWVYRTGNLRRLERIENLAVEAVEALGLDFGAVDIIKDTDGNVYVLEVNTAPGLGNTDTREAYHRAFTGQSPVLPAQDEDDN